MSKDYNPSTVAALLALFIALALLAPLAILWALDTLFPMLNVQYSFSSYLAVLILNCTWFYTNRKQIVKGQ